MSFLSDQRNFSPRTGSGVPPQLIEAASPHLRTSPGLGVAKEAEPGKVEVAQAEVAEIMVNMTKEPAAELAVIRGGGLRLRAVTIPLVGETPTGGERTKFLPHPSKDFSKFISYTNFDPVKLLSADYIQVNPYPVPQGWSRTKDTFSDSSQPRTSLQS